jgi:hypothetical protein
MLSSCSQENNFNRFHENTTKLPARFAEMLIQSHTGSPHIAPVIHLLQQGKPITAVDAVPYRLRFTTQPGEIYEIEAAE